MTDLVWAYKVYAKSY